VILPSTRVVQLGEGFVQVDRDNFDKGFSTTIPFDVSLACLTLTVPSSERSAHFLSLTFQICVIATGSTYGAPMRMIADSTQAAKESLRGLQRKIKDAQRIVLVGGGTVGIEFAGEILDRCVVSPGRNHVLRPSSDSWPHLPVAQLPQEAGHRGPVQQAFAE